MKIQFENYKLIEYFANTIGVKRLINSILTDLPEDNDRYSLKFAKRGVSMWGTDPIIGYHKVFYKVEDNIIKILKVEFIKNGWI